MAQTASDVISDHDVRAVVDQIRNQKYQNRMAFRGYDATDNDSNRVSFPVDNGDFDGEAVEIPEGSEYPRANKEYDEVDAVHTKYGFEIVIPDEKVEDNVIDIVMDQEEDMVRAEEKRIDAIAYNVLSSNASSPGIGDSNGDIVYSDVQEARQEAFLNELDMGSLMLLTGGQNMTDFTNMDEFTQASELGDQVIQQGVLPGGDLVGEQALLGVVSDVPVYLSNTGNYGDGEAYLVDSDNFGWESTRRGMDVTQYREDDKEQDVWQIDGRWDWVATNTEAAIEIDG
jgi:hypothetical protein